MRRGLIARVGVAVTAVAVAVGVLVAPIASAPADAADLSQFDAGDIISDTMFFYSGAMTQAQIQSFLVAKESSCAASAICVKDYYTVTKSVAADPMCGAYSGGYSERASAIIYKVAQACGINPQVLLVTMQKEQGLITSVWPSDYAYAHAMGADCPDTTGCNTISAGFFAQVYKSAWQMKRYANPSGTSAYFTWYAPGHTWNILYNPNSACGTKAVYIKSQATADLYYYTPYTPNAAALAAGYGTGDSCSAYGNRNFFNYFTDWFGSTHGPGPCAVPAAAQTTAAGGEFTVNVSSLNGRQAPNTSCSTGVVSLPQGTVLLRVATYSTWSQVRYNGQVLWVASQYLTPTPNSATFVDVPWGAPFYTEVSWVAAKGISTGWPQPDGTGLFKPFDPIGRDAMAAFLYRYEGSPAFTSPATSPFTDVPTDYPFYKEITWLASTGITTGWTETDGSHTFRPTASIGRDAMAAFLYRAAGGPAFTPPATSPFTDVPIDYPFYKEITWLASKGITTGYDNGNGTRSYHPTDPIARNAMAAFLYRYAGSPAFTPPGG